MTSRLVLSSALLGLSLGLAACAGTPRQPYQTYGEELARLNADCVERGGVLVPSGSGSTGRPSVDNVCRISGASRIP